MRYLQIFLVILFIFSCSPDGEKHSNNTSVIRSPLNLSLENQNSNIKQGEVVRISASQSEDFEKLSDLKIYVNDSLYFSPSELPGSWSIESKGLPLGRNVVRMTAAGTSRLETKTLSFIVMPGKSPVRYTYKVLASHPHDKYAYTQGLFFHNNFIYEGTGQRGQSSLRKVDMESGRVLQMHELEKNLFGEGICLFGDKIYQLSWVSQVGFIYDAESFTELARFYYEGEGWGIASDGQFLYRSDGSNKLYVHDPSNFSVITTIEVYSDEGPINRLNELEYIEGKIYANIWQSDDIAIIDPKTGACEGMLNLKGILPNKERDSRTDVLNGIAWDEEGKRLYVTGKNWPRIFEISISGPSS